VRRGMNPFLMRSGMLLHFANSLARASAWKGDFRDHAGADIGRRGSGS
jgi:hypothetical protein